MKDVVKLRLEQLGDKSGIARARRVGLGRDFIRDIVSGKKKSVGSDKLPLLAKALGLDAQSLADGKLILESEIEKLSQEEQDLIDNFRVLPEGIRQAIVVLSQSGKAPGPPRDKE